MTSFDILSILRRDFHFLFTTLTKKTYNFYVTSLWFTVHALEKYDQLRSAYCYWFFFPFFFLGTNWLSDKNFMVSILVRKWCNFYWSLDNDVPGNFQLQICRYQNHGICPFFGVLEYQSLAILSVLQGDYYLYRSVLQNKHRAGNFLLSILNVS